MSGNSHGHSHGGKSHLLAMFGIGALVLVALLLAGRSFREALPLAALLACPLMIIGMIFMMRGGNGHQHDNDSADHRDHRDHNTPAEWPSPVGTNAPAPPEVTRLS